MPIGELLRALEADADSDRRGLLDDARREAAALDAHARANAERRRTATLDAYRDRRRAAADAAIAQTERGWRGRILASRARMLERVRAAATRRAARADVVELVDRLVAEVARGVGDAPAALRCRAALAESIREAARGRSNLRVEVDDEAGNGVRAETDDGRVTVDATLEALLEQAWPALRIEALRCVEEDGA